MSRDPKYYTDPSTFNPGRFLKEVPELDPYIFAFGFGRRWRSFLVFRFVFESYIVHFRVCPGKKLADSSLFISISMILATFNIHKAKDEHGNIIEPDCTYQPGVVRSVYFMFFRVPRHARVLKLLLQPPDSFSVFNYTAFGIFGRVDPIYSRRTSL